MRVRPRRAIRKAYRKLRAARDEQHAVFLHDQSRILPARKLTDRIEEISIEKVIPAGGHVAASFLWRIGFVLNPVATLAEVIANLIAGRTPQLRPVLEDRDTCRDDEP